MQPQRDFYFRRLGSPDIWPATRPLYLCKGSIYAIQSAECVWDIHVAPVWLNLASTVNLVLDTVEQCQT